MGEIERMSDVIRAAAVALLFFTVRTASAEEALAPPWEITGTSSIAVPPESTPTHRVDRRTFLKDSRFLLRSGFSYLSRGDYYSNPGIGVDFAYYPAESLGVDIISANVFFSSLGPTARALRESTGLLPDSQRPYARITTGGRLAFAYGKVLIEELDVVIHLDLSAAAHLGMLITDQAANLGGDFGLAFQAHAHKSLLVWLEGLYVMSYEKRTASSFASGPMITIGLGYLL